MMKNLIKSLFIISIAFLLIGCTEAVELVDQFDNENLENDVLEDPNFGTIPVQEETKTPNSEEKLPNEEESYPDEGISPEEGEVPFPYVPSDDLWMPQIKNPDVKIILDYEASENLLELFNLHINKDHYQIIMIHIDNPFEPTLVNEETVAYTESKIIEYEINKLGLSYTWYTRTIYIYPAFVTYEQLVSLFTLAQKTDVKVNFDIYY
jgi:hypothetical protein